jgi:hypothetical protein
MNITKFTDQELEEIQQHCIDKISKMKADPDTITMLVAIEAEISKRKENGNFKSSRS